jgi:hypothetical protein
VATLAVLALLVLGFVVPVMVVRRRKRPQVSAVSLTNEWRRVRLTRLAGIVVGLGAAAVLWHQGSFGRGPMLAPAVFGLCLVLGVGLGEAVVRPTRASGVRSASLAPRRLSAYVPRTPAVLAGTMVLLTTVLLSFTTLTAGRDDYTHTMRALRCDTALVGSSTTPYPGSYYSLPLGLLLVAVLGLAAVASRQVIVRPRGLATDDVGDDALRRRSLDVIVSAVGIAASAPYTGLALTAGGALQDLGDSRPSCAPLWMQPVGVAISLSALVAVVVAMVCLASLLAGNPQRLARPAALIGS